MEFGGHLMAGVEIRLSRALSLNLDYRFTQVGSKSHQHALGGALGFHW
jgi:opacity protein-like surface antigen